MTSSCWFLGRDESVLEDLSNWDIVYEIGLVVWIIFGLGYIFMVIAVITEALRKPAKSAARRFKRGRRAMMARVLTEVVNMKVNGQQREETEVPAVNGSLASARSVSEIDKEMGGAEQQYDNLGLAMGAEAAVLTVRPRP